MTVFIEMYSELEIREQVKGAKRIAIIGCPICMNCCLAAQSDEKVLQEIDLTSALPIPWAIINKMAELKIALGGPETIVTSHLARQGSFNFCGLERNYFDYLTKDEEISSSDVIVSLSCPAGMLGLEKLFPKHRIVSATRPPKGVLFNERETTEDGRITKIIPGTATPLYFAKDKATRGNSWLIPKGEENGIG